MMGRSTGRPANDINYDLRSIPQAVIDIGTEINSPKSELVNSNGDCSSFESAFDAVGSTPCGVQPTQRKEKSVILDFLGP